MLQDTLVDLFNTGFYLIGMWYSRAEAQRRFSFFFSSTSLAGAFGGLLASAIGKMDRLRGYHGWRWIFLLEGTLTCVVALALFFLISDFPENAKWLTEEERACIEAKQRREQGDPAASRPITVRAILRVFSDYKVFLGGFMYLGLIVSAYGMMPRHQHHRQELRVKKHRLCVLLAHNHQIVWLQPNPDAAPLGTSLRGRLCSRYGHRLPLGQSQTPVLIRHVPDLSRHRWLWHPLDGAPPTQPTIRRSVSCRHGYLQRHAGVYLLVQHEPRRPPSSGGRRGLADCIWQRWRHYRDVCVSGSRRTLLSYWVQHLYRFCLSQRRLIHPLLLGHLVSEQTA